MNIDFQGMRGSNMVTKCTMESRVELYTSIGMTTQQIFAIFKADFSNANLTLSDVQKLVKKN